MTRTIRSDDLTDGDLQFMVGIIRKLDATQRVYHRGEPCHVIHFAAPSSDYTLKPAPVVEPMTFLDVADEIRDKGGIEIADRITGARYALALVDYNQQFLVSASGKQQWTVSALLNGCERADGSKFEKVIEVFEEDM